MPKRISKTNILTVAFAIVALLAATDVSAEYTGSFDATGYTWFEHLGCKVEIATPFPEVIDCAAGKCSKYTYMVTCPTSHSDILIGRDMLSAFVKAECDGDDCTSIWEPKCDGTGESSTTFGRYLIWNCVGKWNTGWSDSGTHRLSLIFEGKDLGSSPTDFLIKHGQVLKYGPIQGPAPSCGVQVEPNQPLASQSTFNQSGYTFSILYDENGQSWDVVCPDGSCTVDTINIEDLRLYVEDQAVATVTWLPYDTPAQSAASPGCTYVRVRSGVVKKVCD